MKPLPMTDYPKALIPTDPVIDMGSIALSGRRHVSSVLDCANALQVTSGRMAIGLALQHMKLTTGDEVLIPAYHSRSMVEPVVWIGARPVFYRIHPDTAVDLDDVAASITGRTRLLVVVNYFGFPQDLVRIRAFCDTHGLLMLEDCAHAFLGEYAGQPLGSFGDYAIASSMKLFPVVDGGCLVSSRHCLDDVRLNSAGLKFELKTVFNTLEKSFAYGRLRPVALMLALPMMLKNRLWALHKAKADANSRPIGPRASDGAFGFEPEWLNKRASLISRLILWTVSWQRAACARRANYLRLAAACADLPGCAPLYARLPDGVFPWVFPLRVDAPAQVFPQLKNAGVPVIRFAEFLWDDVDATVCPVSVDLSRRVMQFPCHQALRPAEIDWMIATVRAIILGCAVSAAQGASSSLHAAT